MVKRARTRRCRATRPRAARAAIRAGSAPFALINPAPILAPQARVQVAGSRGLVHWMDTMAGWFTVRSALIAQLMATLISSLCLEVQAAAGRVLRIAAVAETAAVAVAPSS